MQNDKIAETIAETRSDPKYLLALVVLCGIVNFYGLSRLPLIGPDEPRYAEVAREMYLSGDWITPKLGGIDWFEKPVLTYWLSAAGYRLFGVSEFGARFGIAMTATIGVLMIFIFGRRIRSSRYGYLSASTLAVCGLWPAFSRGATFDLPLSVALALALLSFYLWERTAEKKYWIFFSLGIGLAVLAKGLVGIVLPPVIIVVYLLLIKRLKIVFNPVLLLLGLSIIFITAATWYWPVIARHGGVFIDEFFIAHHFQRYLSNKYKHPQPPYFFIIVILAGSFPWTAYLFSGAWRIVRQWRTKGGLDNDRLNLFLWLWVLIPTIFFSFSGSKLPGYILPVFPALAMIVGRELEEWWSDDTSERMSRRAIATASLIFAAALVVALRGEAELGIRLIDLFKLATTAILVAVVYLFIWFLISGRAATLFLPFGLMLVLVVTANLIFPVLGNNESLRDLSLLANRNAGAGERLVFYVNADHGINFYATDLPLRDEKSELITAASPEEVERSIRATGGASILIASPGRWAGGVKETERLKVEKLGEQKRSLRCSPDCDWILFRAKLKIQ